ncbi:MAG TPA: hypothetical protein VNZ61_21995 [Roseomonas sp.]|nr:hypothetical protein [Roseomonas sp.]
MRKPHRLISNLELREQGARAAEEIRARTRPALERLEAVNADPTASEEERSRAQGEALAAVLNVPFHWESEADRARRRPAAVRQGSLLAGLGFLVMAYRAWRALRRR